MSAGDEVAAKDRVRRERPNTAHSQRRATGWLRLRLLFAYSGGVPNRQCRVSFTDPEGITHCTEVTAESLYEAAVLAMAEFHRCGFTDAQTGPATRLNIAVLAPSTSHEISVGKVRAWLDTNGRSPAQQALKVRLRDVLGKA